MDQHTIHEFIELAFGHMKLNWKEHVKKVERFFRSTEIHELRGDYSKAQTLLDWEPSGSFKELVRRMVDGDLEHYMTGMCA